MDSINSSTLTSHSVNITKPAQTDASGSLATAPLKVEQNSVTLSSEGKALLEALKQIEKNTPKEKKEDGITEQMESFAHGALGMDHPDKIEEEDDSSYSAGQYLSAAVTIGGILLALV